MSWISLVYLLSLLSFWQVHQESILQQRTVFAVEFEALNAISSRTSSGSGTWSMFYMIVTVLQVKPAGIYVLTLSLNAPTLLNLHSSNTLLTLLETTLFILAHANWSSTGGFLLKLNSSKLGGRNLSAHYHYLPPCLKGRFNIMSSKWDSRMIDLSWHI